MFRSRSNYFNYRLVIKCLTAGRLRQHDIKKNLKAHMLALIIQKSAEHVCCITDRVMDYSPAQSGFNVSTVFSCLISPPVKDLIPLP